MVALLEFDRQESGGLMGSMVGAAAGLDRPWYFLSPECGFVYSLMRV